MPAEMYDGQPLAEAQFQARSRAIKAAKARKATIVKATKAMKKVSARMVKRKWFQEVSDNAWSSASACPLVKNKAGKIVSKKMSDNGKKNPWIASCNAAKQALHITGFVKIKNGSAVYKKAIEIYRDVYGYICGRHRDLQGFFSADQLALMKIG